MYLEQKRYNLRADLCFHFVQSFSLRQKCSGKIACVLLEPGFCSEEIFKASNLSENVIVMFDETTPSTKTHQRDIRPDLPVAAKVMARGNINQRVVRT